MSKGLIISDVHIPAEHEHALRFCKEIYKKEKCDWALQIGDLVDWHSISFHSKEPGMPNATAEFKIAYSKVQDWHKAFPKLKVIIGNHSGRPQRLAKSVNIPDQLIKTYNDMWGTPGWEWAEEFFIDNVQYIHGEGMGGMYPAANACKNIGMSVVSGHIHSCAMIWWQANKLRRTFGMTVGCLIDDKSLAFQYAANTTKKSLICVGTVEDGIIPQLHMMPMSQNEKYGKR
jgi:predicted phosphodiesterase